MDKVHSVAELIERTQGMPLEKMRFFINEDRREPRCFGIYQEADTGSWVVYKNKADGSRAVRYSGPDEGYAAQELWAKINSEIELRRAKKRTGTKMTRGEKIVTGVIMAVVAALIGTGLFFVGRWIARQPNRGYYLVDQVLYYWQDDDWYYYGDGAWYEYDDSLDYDTWHDEAQYYGATYPEFEEDDQPFESSRYYVEHDDADDDSSDNTSIFDSWDSNDTDWTSDW